MLESKKHLELADFDGLVNETFVFSLEGVEQKVEGVLIKAEPMKSGTAPGVAREPFSLEFKFPPGADIGQCLLQAKTAKGEAFPPMFLVPRGADEVGWYMEAIFN